ncbi:hypothetical protein PIB30_052306 [Stylosanthes scabra]|uniref:Aminotransferase-like plant mobile domain-containing protein n=1 Tax=Stylosanthes scabra TaxID=79078 RepID=A0ABU6SI39_9FABA|nr:hypothetical protein [Stylosanthes scabra]
MVEQYLGARPPMQENAQKESFSIRLVWPRDRLHAVLTWTYRSLCNAAAQGTTNIAGCVPLILSWIYHRFPEWSLRATDHVTWPLAERLIGAQQPARDQQECRLLQWRSRIDRVSVDQALIPDWMRSQPEVYTWRRSPEVLVTVHFGGDPRGTQQYYEWFARVAKRGRFLSRALDLADPRWTLAPAGIPAAAVHPRDDLVMPNDAPALCRRQAQEPRPR